MASNMTTAHRPLMDNPEFEKLWQLGRRLQKREVAERKKAWEEEQAWSTREKPRRST